MRTILIICLSAFLFSCVSRDVEIDRLNQRMIRLELKIDSLISGRNSNTYGYNNGKSPVTYPLLSESGRCQALTKKGTQCKRKARANSFCWQHGG